MCNPTQSPYLTPEGLLKIEQWGYPIGNDSTFVDLGLRAAQMAHSNATGQGLVTNGKLGADLIRLEAGDGFVPHTHPGDHLLIVLGGQGTITYDGNIYPTHNGQIYLINGEVPHAVGAITHHLILAVGSPHKAVDDPARMQPVEYQAVTADIGSLNCLICNKTATYPEMLHDTGCLHCPCATCNPIHTNH